MNTVAFGQPDFTSPPVEPSDHWCVCSGKTVIGGLFDTEAEATGFAKQAITTHANLSIHHVGAQVSESPWQRVDTAPFDVEVLTLQMLLHGDQIVSIGTQLRTEKGGCWLNEESCGLNPSHWMPIPKAPKS